MTLKVNNFVFLVNEVLAIDRTVENSDCFWFYITFKNGETKQMYFSFRDFFHDCNDANKKKLREQIEKIKTSIRHYMSDYQRDLEIII